MVSRAAKLALTTLVGALLLVAVFHLADLELLCENIAKASPIWLIASSAAQVIFYLLRGLRWKLILHHVKPSANFSVMFWATTVGYLVNTLLPIRIGGEVVRALIIDRRERVGFAQALSSVGVERVLDLVGIALLGVLGLTFMPRIEGVPSWLLDGLRVAGGLMLIVLVLLIAGTRKEKALLGFSNRLFAVIPLLSSRRRGKLQRFTAGIVEGAKGLSRSPESFTLLFASTLAIWLSQFLAIYMLFKAFTIEAAWTIILFGAMIQLLSFALPAPPGFIGSYETYWTLVFLSLKVAEFSLLVAMGVVNHIITVLVIVALGYPGIIVTGSSLRTLFKPPRLAPES